MAAALLLRVLFLGVQIVADRRSGGAGTTVNLAEGGGASLSGKEGMNGQITRQTTVEARCFEGV